MENGPFQDVFPIKNGDIPASYVSLLEGTGSRRNPLVSYFQDELLPGNYQLLRPMAPLITHKHTRY